MGALRPLPARELCSFVRVVAVLALTLGLLAMHGLGSGHTGHELVPASHAGTQDGAGHEGSGHAASAHDAAGHAAAAHAGHEDGPSAGAQLMAHEKRLRDAGPGAACVPADPEEHSAAHCTPAPGAVAPVPPAVVVLDRSDALPHAPAAAAPRSVLARAPAPDLALLSISRT